MPEFDDIKKAIDEQNRTFEEFKQKNDENEKKRDSLLEDQVNRINEALNKFEPLNQKITLQEQSSKKAEEDRKAMQEQLDRMETALNRPPLAGGRAEEENKEWRDAVDIALRKAPADRTQKELDAIGTINKYVNTLKTSIDTGAGYLLAPPDMMMEIIKDLTEISPFRSLASVVTIGKQSWEGRKRTSAATATRVGETQARTNTGDPAYGMLSINAPELFARFSLSVQMMEDADYDLLGELRMESVEQFDYQEGYEFINGAADGKHAEGILTNGDISTVNSGHASQITADGMIDLWGTLKTRYARNAVFIMERLSIAAIRKLKDGQGNYLWQPGIAGSVPSTILDSPYVEMPDMPTATTSTYPVAYGDFRRGYKVVDRVGLSFQADYTTEADDGAVVLRARKRVGGGVVLPAAIKKLRCHT